MPVGLNKLLASVSKRRAVLALLCGCAALLLIISAALATGGAAVETAGPELVTVLLSDWSTFEHTAKEWIFTAVPLQVARGNWQVRLKDAVLRETGMKLEHGEEEWREAGN